MFDYIELKIDERSSVETEIRFAIATATVDKHELIAFAFSLEDESNKKYIQSIRRTLTALKKEGKISFFIDYENINSGSTEAEFLKNKYATYLCKQNYLHTVYFVKI